MVEKERWGNNMVCLWSASRRGLGEFFFFLCALLNRSAVGCDKTRVANLDLEIGGERSIAFGVSVYVCM